MMIKFGFAPIEIQVDIPALDRLLDLLEGHVQREIDASTSALTAATSRLQQSRKALEAIIQKGEQ